jgi:hypothetical protein
MATRKKVEKPDKGKTARRVARNVVGIVKAARPMETDSRKKKPKHKKELAPEPDI